MTTVTILIDNYNYARFLADAIDSALAQTAPGVDVLVVDDGSTDDSAEVMARYRGHPRVRLLHLANGGQNAAVARALSEVTAEHVWILDADDYLEPDAVAAALPLMQGGANVVLGRMRQIDPEGATIGEWPNNPFIRSGFRAFVERNGYLPSSPTSGNLFRTAFAKRAIRHSLPRTTSVDGHLLFKAGLTDRVAVLDRIVATYRVHGANWSGAVKGDYERLARSTAIWVRHAENTRLFYEAEIVHGPTSNLFISAYTWRRLMIISLAAPHLVEGFSPLEIARRGVPCFLRSQQTTTLRKVKNIAFLIAAAAPAMLRREFMQVRPETAADAERAPSR